MQTADKTSKNQQTSRCWNHRSMESQWLNFHYILTDAVRRQPRECSVNPHRVIYHQLFLHHVIRNLIRMDAFNIWLYWECKRRRKFIVRVSQRGETSQVYTTESRYLDIYSFDFKYLFLIEMYKCSLSNKWYLISNVMPDLRCAFVGVVAYKAYQI